MGEPIAPRSSDTESQIVASVWAVIYTPQRNRQRFPENCVTVHEDEVSARLHSNPAKSLYAALVNGPSRSSEGFRLYYLIRWLD